MFEAIIGAITGIWAVGAAFLLARAIVGMRIVATLRRNLAPFDNLPAGTADRLRRTLGVNSLPPITLSRRIGGPATLGLWPPIVVLPADLAAERSADELHDALAHECAHALRRDARIALVQQIIAALYWIHPLVHVLNRQLARAREEVCDNVVLAGTSPTDYARTLLALSQTVQSTRGRIAVIPMFDSRWHLAPRVAGLLNTRRIVMARITKRALALVAAISLAVGATLAAISAAGEQPTDAKSDPKPSEPAAAPEKAANADKLQRFLEERVKLADEAYRLLQASYEAGTMTLDPLMAASNDLTEAMLAMSKTKAERIAIREKQVERANDLEAKLKALNKVNARGGEADKVARAGANRIRAEIALERERRNAPAATEPDALPTNAPKSVDGEKGTEALAPKGVFSKLATDDSHLADADENRRKALQEVRFDERKAELDVREAVALLGVKNYTYEKVVDANEKVPGAVPIKEIKLDKAEADVAAIHVEQAKLSLERARATIERISPHVYIAYSPETWIATNLHDTKGKLNPRSLPGYGGANEHPDLVFGEMTVKSALAGYLQQPRDLGPARVAVVRYKGTLCKTLAAADELKPTDGVLVRDLVAGKAKNEIVHHGDFIILFGGRFWAEKPADGSGAASPPAVKQ